MLPMSLALEKTGASEYISNSLVSGLGGYGPLALMAGIYFTTSLMTMFISNTATAVLLAPIAMQSALQIGVSPYPGMTGGELMEELIYYGVSAISLSTTGSNQEGLRACTSFIKPHQYALLEERLKLFKENHTA